MTVSYVARHKVNDYATWKKMYDESVSFRTEKVSQLLASIATLLTRIWSLLFLSSWMPAKQKRWLRWLIRKRDRHFFRKKGGVSGPVESWVFEDVEHIPY